MAEQELERRKKLPEWEGHNIFVTLAPGKPAPKKRRYHTRRSRR